MEMGGSKMRTETEVYRYEETLVHYREKARQTVATAQQGSDEYTVAIRQFLRLDGAIHVLRWIRRSEDMGSLPPIIEQNQNQIDQLAATETFLGRHHYLRSLPPHSSKKGYCSNRTSARVIDTTGKRQRQHMWC
jgi:hypothetical protein